MLSMGLDVWAGGEREVRSNKTLDFSPFETRSNSVACNSEVILSGDEFCDPHASAGQFSVVRTMLGGSSSPGRESHMSSSSDPPDSVRERDDLGSSEEEVESPLFRFLLCGFLWLPSFSLFDFLLFFFEGLGVSSPCGMSVVSWQGSARDVDTTLGSCESVVERYDCSVTGQDRSVGEEVDFLSVSEEVNFLLVGEDTDFLFFGLRLSVDEKRDLLSKGLASFGASFFLGLGVSVGVTRSL